MRATPPPNQPVALVLTSPSPPRADRSPRGKGAKPDGGKGKPKAAGRGGEDRAVHGGTGKAKAAIELAADEKAQPSTLPTGGAQPPSRDGSGQAEAPAVAAEKKNRWGDDEGGEEVDALPSLSALSQTRKK